MSIQRELRLPPLSLSERLSKNQRNVGETPNVAGGPPGHRRASGGPPGHRRASTPTAGFLSTWPAHLTCQAGFLSTWPAHVSSQVVRQGHRPVAGPGETSNHGCGGECGGALGKPRFLQRLEGFLQRELQAVDPRGPQAPYQRLQAYRQVFDCFIEDFRTYKPLLSAIKNQYETTLACLGERAGGLEPLRARLVIVSAQCEQRILGLREEERVEVRRLKEERQSLQKVIEDMRETQTSLETQVSCLQEELGQQYLLYREERDARKLLICTLNSLTFDPEEGEEPDHPQDPVTLSQMERLQKDFQQVRSEYQVLQDLHCQVSADRDVLQEEVESFRLTSTPRPAWDQCTEALGGEERRTELFQDQSSQRRLDILLRELVGKTSDFYTGLGLGPEVPVYLRYAGQLKKLSLQRVDLVRVVKEVWKEKVTEDQQRDESSDLAEFLSRHLEKQHGEQAGSWAYSLADGLQHHHNHQAISLFYSILTGKVDESVYHGQTQLLSDLLKVLVQSDVTESGVLSAQEFREALRAALPLKAEEDLEALLAAAENNTGSISYQRLFAEDDEGRHSEFLSLVTEQAAAERRTYISQLRSQLGGRGEVTVEDLSDAFRSIDPSLDSTTLDWSLDMAFQRGQRGGLALGDQQGGLVETELALERLLGANVTRAGPVPEPHH